MTSDTIQIVRFLFTTIWAMFTSWYIPGTNVTPAGMAFFLLVASFVLRTIGYVLNRSGAFVPDSSFNQPLGTVRSTPALPPHRRGRK